MAKNNLDEIGCLSRPPGSLEVNAGELLTELVRLVDSSEFAPKRPTPPVETVSKQDLPDGKPPQALEGTSSPPSFEPTANKLKQPVIVPVKPPQPLEGKSLPPSFKANARTAAIPVKPPRASRSGNSRSSRLNGIGLAESRSLGVWKFRVSALVLAAAAAIGAILWLESEPSEGPALIAAAQSPTPAPAPNNPVVANSSGAEASPPKDTLQPEEGKAVSPEAPPMEPSARAGLENSPPSQDLRAPPGGATQPAAPPAQEPPAAPVNTAAPAEASTPAPQESLDSKAAPTVSLPSEPTPATTPSPSAAADSSGAAHASDAPLPPVRPTVKAAVQTVASAQRSTAKLDSPGKLAGQSGAHAIAKAGASGAGVSGPPANPEMRAKTLEAAQASVAPQATPSPQPGPPATQQPNSNPVARAFGGVAGAVGAVAGLIPFVGH